MYRSPSGVLKSFDDASFISIGLPYFSKNIFCCECDFYFEVFMSVLVGVFILLKETSKAKSDLRNV